MRPTTGKNSGNIGIGLTPRKSTTQDNKPERVSILDDISGHKNGGRAAPGDN